MVIELSEAASTSAMLQVSGFCFAKDCMGCCFFATMNKSNISENIALVITAQLDVKVEVEELADLPCGVQLQNVPAPSLCKRTQEFGSFIEIRLFRA